tara:strand:+ start:43077 stop:43877 length:801 start_codon:yes stop_codon:yes gene_type:complete
MKYFFYNITLIIILSTCYSCDSSKIKSDVNSSENWKSLFNGENLDDWIVKINGYKLHDNHHNTFRAEKGILKVSYDEYDNFTDEFGHLFYKTPFTNYKLKLHYRFVGKQVAGGESWARKNSGIMIHSQAPETMLLKQGFPLSLEVQLLGGVTSGKPRPSGNLCTPATHVVMNGEQITEHCIMAECKTYYGEEWIEAMVVVNNNSITHFIDGKLVISYSMPTIGGEFLNTTSKEIQARDGLPLNGGYISLQSESHPVEFKNIQILEF